MNVVTPLIDAALERWKVWIVNNIPQSQPLNQVYGWNVPAVSRGDLVRWIGQIQSTLKRLPDHLGDEDAHAALEETPARLDWFLSNVLANLQSNHSAVISGIRDELSRLERLIPPPAPAPPLPDWEKLADAGALPKRLANRLRALDARLTALEPRTAGLDQKITVIEDAFNSADQLPTNLAILAEGQAEVGSTRTKVQALAAEATTAVENSKESLQSIETFSEAAEKLFNRLENVYKAAATKGLASAFSKRSNTLNATLAVWVVLLMANLAAGAYIGAQRFAQLETLLKNPLTPSLFWGHIVLSALSLAAPVWFGWVATKQINQRFKLAEDYSFKASVASAYEGYRSEAARLDPEFEKRLFGSALTRLEEAPLRFVDHENFGTPWHELTSSVAFGKALDLVPDLKGTLAKIVASAGGAAAGAAAAMGSLADPKGSNDDSEERAA